jgi:hypothetical protein
LSISAGANVKAVQTMLGHKSAAVTLDTYADLFPDDLEAVAGDWTPQCLRFVNLLRTHCGRTRKRVPDTKNHRPCCCWSGSRFTSRGGGVGVAVSGFRTYA